MDKRRKHPYNGWTHEPSPHFALECDDIFALQELIPRIGGEVL
jgi:hypothetical protein